MCERPYKVKPGGRVTKPCPAGLPFPLGKWNMTAEGRRKRWTTRPGTEDSESVEDVHHLRLTALLRKLVQERQEKELMGACLG